MGLRLVHCHSHREMLPNQGTPTMSVRSRLFGLYWGEYPSVWTRKSPVRKCIPDWAYDSNRCLKERGHPLIFRRKQYRKLHFQSSFFHVVAVYQSECHPQLRVALDTHSTNILLTLSSYAIPTPDIFHEVLGFPQDQPHLGHYHSPG
jgi:hypothetical protein